jgi:hypothetical protein
VIIIILSLCISLLLISSSSAPSPAAAANGIGLVSQPNNKQPDLNKQFWIPVNQIVVEQMDKKNDPNFTEKFANVIILV